MSDDRHQAWIDPLPSTKNIAAYLAALPKLVKQINAAVEAINRSKESKQ